MDASIHDPLMPHVYLFDDSILSVADLEGFGDNQSKGRIAEPRQVESSSEWASILMRRSFVRSNGNDFIYSVLWSLAKLMHKVEWPTGRLLIKVNSACPQGELWVVAKEGKSWLVRAKTNNKQPQPPPATSGPPRHRRGTGRICRFKSVQHWARPAGLWYGEAIKEIENIWACLLPSWTFGSLCLSFNVRMLQSSIF